MPEVYLLDTSIASPAIDPTHSDHGEVSNWLNRLPRNTSQYVRISAVTIGEVRYGISRIGLSEARQKSFVDGLRKFGIEPIDDNVAQTYGEMRFWLVSKFGPKDVRKLRGKQIEQLLPEKDKLFGENDLWIASTAVAYNYVYVTGDTKQQRIFDAAEALYGYTRVVAGMDQLRKANI